MNDLLKNNSLLVGGAAVAIIGAIAYFFFFGGTSITGPLLSSPDDTASPVSNDLLEHLSSLRTIKLDTSIFSNPVYVSLTSFRVEIPSEPVGRANPFAPIGTN